MLGALRDLATEAPIFGSLPPALIFQEEIIPFQNDGGEL